MIDIKDEIKKYKKVNLSEAYGKFEDEIAIVMNGFSKMVERFSKEQYKTFCSIEEIIDTLEEKVENNSITKELVENKKHMESENRKLIKGIININDLFESIYFFARKTNDEKWIKQIGVLWNKISKINLKLGLIRIEDINVSFDNELHRVIQAKEVSNEEENSMIDIVKFGYIYNGEVIRKAEVIVNITTRN
ncbi:protein GrpE [Clostridium tepidiprofundi DSM 19306]|uniref:Protein GrpE n=1 Tax=Clostridium tepidiprofundi DSM 19306 TaxID=1121338 RepID=A0A151B5R0_9CLOT|nr:nucleotide exchange factor GrpE [Clostridium tepidiprofundi]KYH35258.1 protein GrpE [Clostridium tepidiprofundi DSM 19306]